MAYPKPTLSIVCPSAIISVSGFEFTQEMSIFDLLGVHLYHGWLADPSDPLTHTVVTPFSYNQLVEFAINNFSSSDCQKQQEGTLCVCVCVQWYKV